MTLREAKRMALDFAGSGMLALGDAQGGGRVVRGLRRGAGTCSELPIEEVA